MYTYGHPLFRCWRSKNSLALLLFAFALIDCKGNAWQSIAEEDSDSGDSSDSSSNEEGEEGSHSNSADDSTTKSAADSDTDSDTDSNAESSTTDAESSKSCPDRELGMTLPQTLTLPIGTKNELEGSCVNRTLNERTMIWQAPKSARYRIVAESSEAADPVLYVLDGYCEGKELICKDDVSSFHRNAAVELDLKKNQVVTLVAESYDVEDSIEITVGESLRCTSLKGELPLAYEGEIDEKIGIWSSSICGGQGGEQGFVYTAEKEGLYSFRTKNSDFDTVLYTLSEDCGGTEVFCNNDNNNGEMAELTRALQKDESVTVIVDTISSEQKGKFELVVEESVCPELNIETEAEDLEGEDEIHRKVSGTIDGASDTLIASCSRFPTEVVNTPDQVYSWVVPASARYTFDTAGSEFDTVLYILDGSCTGKELGCNRDVNDSRYGTRGDGVSALVLNLEKDQRIMIVVENEIAGESGNFKLNIRQSD